MTVSSPIIDGNTGCATTVGTGLMGFNGRHYHFPLLCLCNSEDISFLCAANSLSSDINVSIWSTLSSLRHADLKDISILPRDFGLYTSIKTSISLSFLDFINSSCSSFGKMLYESFSISYLCEIFEQPHHQTLSLKLIST